MPSKFSIPIFKKGCGANQRLDGGVAKEAKGHRLWLPASITALATLGILAIHLRPELERNAKAYTTLAIVALATLLILIWFLFLSRLRWATRLTTAAVLAVVIFGMTKTLRVDGVVNGIGMPKFAWKWTSVRKLRFDAATAPATTVAPLQGIAGMSDTPQFFGPNRDGVIRGARLARDWNAMPPKELWRQPIGSAWSAFAVVGGRAYTQEQRGEDEAVTCYEALTGRLLWMHSNKVRFFQWQGGEGPRATPTVFQGHVFAYGATGILDCLDSQSGQIVWSHDVLNENHLENLVWGISASPLVFDDTVVVTGGMTEGPTLLAYDRTTGKPLWKAGKDRASYASPTVTTLAGRRVILSVNAASLTIHDTSTGETLLDYPWAPEAKWPKAAQPVALPGDRVFLSAGYGIGCVLLQITADASGKLTATEVWKSMRMKTQFNSVAPRDGFLYGLDDGLLACVDLADGNRKWKSGRFGSGQTLLVDDLIIVQSEPGPVYLVSAKPDGYEELGHIPALNSKTWNHPTLAGRYLLVRNALEAACYELPVQGPEPATANR
jgi:outer membrane protein assembly factor BamB